jgi:hypothetical protein
MSDEMEECIGRIEGVVREDRLFLAPTMITMASRETSNMSIGIHVAQT